MTAGDIKTQALKFENKVRCGGSHLQSQHLKAGHHEFESILG